MKNIAIIPARSGSKGLKDKNIKLLDGKPLLVYSVEAALRSEKFDVVHVSTDSEKYADIARRFGADVQFLRSAETSSDTSSSWDAVREVIENYSILGKTFDTFMLLQPTSPLRTEKDIAEAYECLIKKQANSIVSVCETEHSPLNCNILPTDASLVGFIDNKHLNTPRQMLDTYYRLNGAIYLSKTDYFLTTNDIYSEKCYAYIMDKKRSIDIDDQLDFDIAEAIIIKYKLGLTT